MLNKIMELLLYEITQLYRARFPKKWHWYSFTFTNPRNSITTYHGFKLRQLTISDINMAREKCKIPEPAVTMDISYLGYMSMKYFDLPKTENETSE